ncbi:unnamed protein product, partial [marine sediment metagenome]
LRSSPVFSLVTIQLKGTEPIRYELINIRI